MTKMYEPRKFEKVAAQALFIISDLNPLDDMTPILREKYKNRTGKENIRHRYSFGDCYYFATVAHLILDCQIVEVTYKGKMIHYLIEVEDKMMDINGYMTEKQIAKIYDLPIEERTDEWGKRPAMKVEKFKITNKRSIEELNANIKTTNGLEIIESVVDAIYHLKPGIFKKPENLIKTIKFMNNLYEEIEKFEKKEIPEINLFKLKKSKMLKM